MNDAMTPQEFTKAMQELADQFGGDEEVFHGMADRLLCDTLRSLGYGEGVDIFDNQDKWYA